MKNTFRSGFLILFLLISAGIKLVAQTTSKANSVALINSYMFQDEKVGITKLLNLQNSLNAEFKPKRDELDQMRNKLSALKKQLEQSTGATAERQKLADEAGTLDRSIRLKSEDYEGQLQRRYQALMNPLQQKIGEYLKNWCSQKGYIALIDISKDNNGLILWMNDEDVTNLTSELIKYINSVL